MNRKFLIACGLIVFMAAIGAVVAQEPEAPAEEGEADDDFAPYGRSFPGLADATVGALDLQVPASVVGRLRKTRLGLVPASRPAEAVSAIGWMGGVNYDLDMPAVSRVLESWEDRYGAVVGFAPADDKNGRDMG